jgi:hypothetical protein
MRSVVVIDEYTKLLNQALLLMPEVSPNFFVSREWFAANGWRAVKNHNTFSLLDEDGVKCLPSVMLRDWDVRVVEGEEVWAGFPGLNQPDGSTRLDCQFIYDPKEFRQEVWQANIKLGVPNKSSRIFRKNVRHFLTHHPNCVYVPAGKPDEWLHLFGEWLETQEDYEGIDPTLRYLEDNNSGGRWALFDKDTQTLVGVNIFDQNRRYINFRYCLVNPASPYQYASEIMRWHLHNQVACSGKYVNDGGDLGREELHRFKQKLGPDKVEEVPTWVIP